MEKSRSAPFGVKSTGLTAQRRDSGQQKLTEFIGKRLTQMGCLMGKAKTCNGGKERRVPSALISITRTIWGGGDFLCVGVPST